LILRTSSIVTKLALIKNHVEKRSSEGI